MKRILVEEATQGLIFSSLNGVRYLFDAGTCSVHPWPWQTNGLSLEELYSVTDEDLPGLIEGIGAPAGLTEYILGWRQAAGAFGGSLASSSCTARPNCPDGHPLHEHLAIPASHTRPPVWHPVPSVFSNLILVVTNACNLRCKYCILSDYYEDFPAYGHQKMSYETARKAIDQFLALNETPPFLGMPDRKLDIGFFGGEPLLEGGLIRKVVSYAKSIGKSHYILDFSLTTNLTFLTERMAQFLIENEMGVHVSIDGPKFVHDRYRRNASDKGSFEKMVRNLERLRRLDQRFFDERVRAMVTLNGNSDLLAIRDFFESGDPNVPKIRYVGFIRDIQDAEFHQRYPYDSQHLAGQYSELLAIYKERKRSGIPVKAGDFLYHLFEEALQSVYKRLMWFGTANRSSYTGACTPGRRIAVSPNGLFHICERINENFPIGDVERGFDKEACQEVIRRYYLALPECHLCWARGLCPVCFASACKNDQFSFSKRRCDELRQEVALQLSTLYALLEDRNDAISSGDPMIDRFQLATVTE